MIQKLIDAYELEREMYRKCIDTDEEIEKGRAKWDSGLWIRYKVFEDAITLAPRVDTVKHGHWELSPFDGNWACSNCGNKPYHDNMKNMNYCPNCGYKMCEDRDYEHAVEQLEHNMTFEPTYNPEDGSM